MARMLLMLICLVVILAARRSGAAAPRAVIQAEETIHTWTNAGNGSSPLWTYGSSTLVRRGDDLFFSAIELIPDARPLNNVRWALMQRTEDGWRVVQRDEADRTRENSPIGVMRDGRIFMSVNPTLVPGERAGPAEPRILVFPADDLSGPFETLIPPWDGAPEFTEHSYRGFCVDAEHGECLITHQEDHHAQHWAFLGRDGEWTTGSLVFPDPPEYRREKLRYLYPCLALRDRAAYVFARSGAREPIDEWYEYKQQFGGKNVSRRRLAFSWTPDITTRPLCDWIELVNVMDHGGEVWNCDLYVAPNGDAHILWFEISVQPALRSEFFPDVPIRRYLKHGVVRDGELVSINTLVEGGEGSPGRPHWGRFHVTADGRVFLLYTWWCPPSSEDAGNHTMLLEVLPDGSCSEPVELPLVRPLGDLFMLANPRGGSPPSGVIEAVDTMWADEAPVRYVRIALSDAAPLVRIEGQTMLLPGEGRTVHLRATVEDPQDDVTGVTWRLPGGGTAQGEELSWTAEERDTVELQAVATDAAGNSGLATVLVSVPPGQLADAREPVIIEAEDFVGHGGGEAQRVNIRGNHARCLRGWRTEGQWLEWRFEVAAEGEYRLYARYAASAPGMRLAVAVDGAWPGAAFEDIACAATGMAGEYWSDWAWAHLGPPMRLTAGEHVLRLTAIAGDPYLDMLAIARITP